MSDGGTLLRVRNLRTYFDTFAGTVRAVDGLTFRIAPAQTFALVGESGCGKSVTAFSIMQLLPMPPAFITTEQFLDKVYADKHSPYGGLFETRPAPSRIELEGVNLLGLDEKQMRSYRGGKISMIFQEPMTSLNPVYTCGNQIVEAIRLHRPLAPRKARRLAVEMLARVGIPEPAQRFGEYPHQLSGGMRQRAMIAMALSCGPKLLIADEPTTALDVTIEAQILDLLKEIQAAEGLGILLITHDLAVVAETAHQVGVMYASRMVELTDVKTLFGRPLHPYTRGLFRSLPRLGERKARLATIPGTVPNPLEFPGGCKFHPRCDLARQTAEGLPDNEVVSVRMAVRFALLARRPAKGPPEHEVVSLQVDGRLVLLSPGGPENGSERIPARCVCQEPALREVQPGHWCACWECPGYEDAPQTDPSADTETGR